MFFERPFMIISFSSRHRAQFRFPFLPAGVCLTMVHLIENCRFSFFRFQTCLDIHISEFHVLNQFSRSQSVYIYIYIYFAQWRIGFPFNALFETRRVSAYAFIRGLNSSYSFTKGYIYINIYIYKRFRITSRVMTNIAYHSMNHSNLRSVKSSFNINFQRVCVRRDNTRGYSHSRFAF